MDTNAGAPPSGRSIRDRVLVVDDEPLIRWSVSETLGELGYVVVEAGDARAAIRAASDADTQYGVVVLDIRLPDSDGLGLLTDLHRLMPKARIILMTAQSTPELAASARALGAYGLLHKPFEMSAIGRIVDQASHEPPF